MDCPTCRKSELEEKEIASGLLLDLCPECGGAWFDPGELAKFGAKRASFARSLEDAVRSGQATQHGCPGCHALMNRAWIKEAQLEPSICPSCGGSWLSAPTLKALRHYVAKGDPAPEAVAPPRAADPTVVNWPVVAGALLVAVWAVSATIYKPAPRPIVVQAQSPKPPAPASEPAPRVEVVQVPIERGPSAADLKAMVQAEVQGALKPAAKPDFASAVDRPTYAVDESEARVAVVVGVEKYPDLPAADYAARDARAVRDHLLALGYPARNVLYMEDAEATKGKLTAALNAWLPKRVSKASTVFFYYSGHGAPDPVSHQAYLVPSDGQADDLPDTALPLKQVYAKLDSLGAKHVVVALDSCFSGLGGRSVIAKGTRPLMTKVESAPPTRLTVLSASGPDEISGALQSEGHGAFTYYLLRGLNGDAADEQGRVTISGLYRYLKPQVQDAARNQKRDQTPQLTAGAASGLVLR